MPLPILYSYRRCPYVMRARMALKYANIVVEIREISFSNKPKHMLQLSPKGTVPVLALTDGEVLDESLEIMRWALKQNDSQGWLHHDETQINQLVAENDGLFKRALDAYKYPERYPQKTQIEYRIEGELFLQELESLLLKNDYLLSRNASIADIAIFPFIRQFAAVNSIWFESAPYPKLHKWLKHWVGNDLFNSVMDKQPTYIEPIYSI